MKQSKLLKFKQNELKSSSQKNVGGTQTDNYDGTWIQCKEPSSGGSDTLFEKWPDDGGAVIQIYVY